MWHEERRARNSDASTHDLGVDVAAVLVDALEGEGDGLAALGERDSLDAIVRGGEEDQNASEEGGEGESELHDWNRPAL